MIEIIGHYGALLNDLWKVFDCIMHDLLMAKLQACGVDNDSLNVIYNYLLGANRESKLIFQHKIKIKIWCTQRCTFNFQNKCIRPVL